MSFIKRFKSILIGVGILAFGIIGLVIMISLRPEPPKEERVVLAPLVQTRILSEQEGNLTVTGSGTM